MRELELKGVVADERRARDRIEADGATLVFEGELLDRRYDMPTRPLTALDHVLRLRVERAHGRQRAVFAYKGPASLADGYKLREELGTGVEDPSTMHEILCAIGYAVTREIDREVAVYALHGAVVRFERYPRMDVLVEVEGDAPKIEQAIASLGIPRGAFTPDALAVFVREYERRTGARAAICRRELAGDFRYEIDDG